jgi:transposase
LEQELKTGKGFSSYGAIVEWLKQEYGLEIEYATVYALVRYKLGASGVKPTVPVKWPRENFWIYGAIEPLTGQHFQQEYPKLNGDYFQQFLDWLSQQLGEDYAILQVDQAPAHICGAINWPENILPLFQPPHSPELNPIERLWQFLKKPLHFSWTKTDKPFSLLGWRTIFSRWILTHVRFFATILRIVATIPFVLRRFVRFCLDLSHPLHFAWT